jgi:hypothetical protein
MNELTLAAIPTVIEEVEKAFFDIPFENSDFQTRNFVIAAQITPERAYRAIGLRLSTKIRALKEAMYSRQLEDIDLEEMEWKIADESLDIFEARRLKIKIEQKREARAYTDKLVNDALHECSVLYAEFVKFPKFSREEFEAAEKAHFNEKLLRQINGCTGASESLNNMHTDVESLSKALLQLGVQNGTN